MVFRKSDGSLWCNSTIRLPKTDCSEMLKFSGDSNDRFDLETVATIA